MKREINTVVKTLLALVLVWMGVSAQAQRFANVSLNGSQTVYGIAQDKTGLMWLGTENGLYCYDGYRSWSLFQPHTVSQSRVNALAFQGDSLFLATGNGVLVYHTPSNQYSTSSASGNSHNSSQHKLSGEQRVVNYHSPHAAYGSDVYALLQTPKGLLVGTVSGLYLEPAQPAKAQKNTSAKATKRIPVYFKTGRQTLVNALTFDAKRQCYWIGTEGALYRADLQLKSFVRVEVLDGNSVKCLALDKTAHVYIGTDNGLYVLARDGRVSHYIHNSRDVSSISNNVVWACCVDKWQNVWLGTDNGLSRLVTHGYYRYFPWEHIAKSGEGNCLHAIMQDKTGGWWMGGTNGLVRFVGDDAVWYKQNNPAFPLSHNRVRKFYEDRDGDIWVATDHGINLYDRTTRQMHNVVVLDKSGRYSTVWAYDIQEDAKGRMWLASYSGGVFVIDKTRLKQTASTAVGTATATCVADLHFSDCGKNALAGLHVGQLVIDKQGMVWASSNLGLDVINPTSWKVTHIAKTGAVNFLMADHKGYVWTGGATTVCCYDGTKVVKTWNIGSPVSCMCDVEGSIWAVSAQECSVLNRSGNSRRFKIPSVTPLAIYYSASSKRVVMGGNDGFLTVDAAIAQPKEHPTPLILTNVVVNGKSMHDLKNLTLSSDENNFTLQLSDLPFANHASDVYAYQLEGSDHVWRTLEDDNIDITYNGLPYGDYHLTVHVVDGEGNVGDEVYSLDISILPPWYLTIWAKIVYFLIAVLLAIWMMNFYLVRKRLHEERRQKEEILAQVETRMNFFTKLSERLRTAVAKHSFEEITELINSSFGVKETSAPELSEADQRLLKEINEAIEQHMIDTDFNVSTLQELVGVGSKQLYRKVKAMTGMTPVEYIRDQRMRKASMMLREGKFSVSEVMYSVGFSNSSYFSKCFSKAFGMTPTEYMKK